VAYDHRQERRGRPGPNPGYLGIERHCLFLTWSTDADAVTYDAASDGCFPMVTCDTEMTEAELLAAYKRQPRLECRHATFKGVIAACPVELKSDYRIDAFGFCLYVALLVHALSSASCDGRWQTPGSMSFPSTTRTGPARRRLPLGSLSWPTRSLAVS